VRIGSLRVLMYHRIMDPRDATWCDPALISATPSGFAEQMRYLAAQYAVVSASEVRNALTCGRPLPRRAVLITFDDACRDFAEIAWPILRRHGLAATIFVPTAYPGCQDRTFWWDRLYRAVMATRKASIDNPAGGVLSLDTMDARRASLRKARQLVKSIPHSEAMRVVERLCRELGEDRHVAADVLTWPQLRELARDGVTIGAHTRTHPALTQMTVEDARAEISESREDVHRALGIAPFVFAYPFGDHDSRVVELVREAGYDLAVTCRAGHNLMAATDPLRLRRANVTRRTTIFILGARLTPLGGYADRWRHRGSSSAGDQRSAAPAQSANVGGPGPRVAYVMSRFPKLSETFVLNEVMATTSLGANVDLYPLLRGRQATLHPEVAEWMRRAHYYPFVSLQLLRANAHFVRRQPTAYVRAFVDVLRGTWGNRKFVLGALVAFPKAVCFAYEMRRHGVAQVHAHFATHPTVAAFIINRLVGIPFSFTAHGSDLHVDRRMLQTKVDASRFAITVSEFNKRIMVETCGEGARDKIRVIHCGVDCQYFKPAVDARRSGRFRLVCVASFEEVKGHRYLIDACSILRDRGTDFQCDLVGDGPLRPEIERQVARAGLGNRVRFHGAQPRPNVARLLSAANAAVLASHPTRQGKREGIPVALMEAMAAALPVVSTAISGIPELVDHGETGFLVPSGDPGALADALDRLAHDVELCERMGNAGRVKVSRDFDLYASARQLLTLFAGGAASQPFQVDAATGPQLATR
jgi:glycosyltransferase involved in cell wall biosynthesis